MLCVDIFFFFFNDTATTEIYTLSLHDALPICRDGLRRFRRLARRAADREPDARVGRGRPRVTRRQVARSEEHTSELQSRQYLVCRLLLEKKKKKILPLSRYHHEATDPQIFLLR